MARTQWSELPALFRDAIQAHVGDLDSYDPAPSGNHADFAGTLRGKKAGKPLTAFVKAAKKVSPDQDGPEVWSLRNEAAINPHMDEFAPRLLWEVEAGGWLGLGFEYIDGRHADLSPGSADLSVL